MNDSIEKALEHYVDLIQKQTILYENKEMAYYRSFLINFTDGDPVDKDKSIVPSIKIDKNFKLFSDKKFQVLIKLVKRKIQSSSDKHWLLKRVKY